MPFNRAFLLCFVLAVAASNLGAIPAPIGAVRGSAIPETNEHVDTTALPPKRGIPGLDGQLSNLFIAHQGGAATDAAPAHLSGLTVIDGQVRVVAEVEGERAGEAADAIRAAGGVLETAYDNWLQALLPVAALPQLGSAPGIRYVRAPYSPQSMAITSEGVPALGLEKWHATGLRGAGAKLAVLDLGFDGYWNVLGTELPRQPIIRSFRTDGDITGTGDTHGTAAAEVAFDVAPEATFYLVNFATEAEMGSAVDWLISEHVNVISSSVGWPGTAYGDGKGSVNAIVAKAERAGITWVQAAGNYGNSHWTGFFNDPDGNGFNNFRGTDEGNTIRLRRTSAGDERIFRVEVFLTWDDWDTLNQDYDLFLFRGEAVVAQSTAFQNGQFPPVEHIVYTTASPGDYWIGIQRFRASRRTKLDLVVTTEYEMEYREPSESLVIPADSPFAVTVGAVAPNTLDARIYSSRGPTKDGRPKPDLVAADGVSTFISGPLGFSGTSASAPAIAGAGALFVGARPNSSPAKVRAFLTSHGQSGAARNNVIGFGRLFLGELPVAAALPIIPNRSTIGARQ